MNRSRPIPVRSQVAAAVSAVLVPGMLTVPAPVLAQDALEEIVVTATRRTRSVQEIPINITALNTGELEKNRLYGLAEISKLVPGLQIVDRGPRDDAPDIIVRGLNSDALGPGFSSGTVATYLGDIPVEVDLKTNDLQTVEVLIGPQGTLYGSGTLGGAIRYIPNKPDASEFSAEVHTSVYGLSEAASISSDTGFVLNVPLIQDQLAVRASVDYLDDSGFIDYNYVVREGGVSNPEPNFADPADVAQNLRRVEDADSEETISGRIGLRWMPTDAIDATLWYYVQNVNAGGRTITHVEAFNSGPYESALRYEEPNEYDNQLFSLEVTADLGFAELTSATGYALYEELGQRDQTDLLLDFEYGYEFFPSFSSFTREIVEEETLVQELRLVSTGEGPFSWIVGGYYNSSDLFASSEEFTPRFDQFAIDNFGGAGPRPDALEYFELTVEDFTEQALFGEVSYSLTDAWDVTLGFRFYEFETEVDNGFDLPLLRSVFLGDAPDSPPLGADAAASGFTIQNAATDDDGSLFKFNTSYRIDGAGGAADEALVYLTVSEGYRIGGVNSVPECTDQDLANPGQALCAKSDEILIKPDKTTNYEIGLHSTWLDNSLLLNAALFYIDWEDIQVSAVTDNGNLPITANGSGAVSQGVELTSRYVINENWEIGGNLAYTNAELTEDAPGLVGSLTAPDGARLPGSPETQGAFFADYSRLLQDGRTFSVRYLMSYTGDVFNIVGGDSQLPLDPDNGNLPTDERKGESIPGYALHNLSATLEDANWKVTLFADNLFDKRAITGTRTTKRLLAENRGLINGFRLRSYGRYVTRPRSFGVSFTYNF